MECISIFDLKDVDEDTINKVLDRICQNDEYDRLLLLHLLNGDSDAEIKAELLAEGCADSRISYYYMWKDSVEHSFVRAVTAEDDSIDAHPELGSMAYSILAFSDLHSRDDIVRYVKEHGSLLSIPKMTQKLANRIYDAFDINISVSSKSDNLSDYSVDVAKLNSLGYQTRSSVLSAGIDGLRQKLSSDEILDLFNTLKVELT